MGSLLEGFFELFAAITFCFSLVSVLGHGGEVGDQARRQYLSFGANGGLPILRDIHSPEAIPPRRAHRQSQVEKRDPTMSPRVAARCSKTFPYLHYLLIK